MILPRELTLAVVAKPCLPGRVKTRLMPPYSPAQAARIAQAALDDTLATASALPVGERVLFFDGETDPPRGWRRIRQPEGSLDVRLAALFDEIPGPLLLIGMDTPQLTAAELRGPLHDWADGIDGWIGDAADGGFWAVALRRPRGDLVRGVAMSRGDTGARQRERLSAHGLRIADLPRLRDVDIAADARAVAAQTAGSRFARAVTEETA